MGKLTAQTRLPSFAALCNSRVPVSPWICRRCTLKASTLGQRRCFSNTAALPAAVDVNAVPRSIEAAEVYADLDTFARRHIGPDDIDTAKMLKALSPPAETLNGFVKQVIPADILTQRKMRILRRGEDDDHTISESALIHKIQELGEQNRYMTSFIGLGYYGTHTPAVVQRNVLENPAWYTSYTPYQPEISQGRLESLVNFQTMVSDLTALPISNASLLDEGTAAAEAMTLSMNALPSSRARRVGKTFVVSSGVHTQTINVLRGRADGFGIRILELDLNRGNATSEIEALGDDLVGVMVQYPDTRGRVENYRDLAGLVHRQGALLSCATDLLALTILIPPGEWGADIAFGSAQRFGIPMGFGGPHAAFFAVTEKYKRKIPGRLVGLSKDRLGGKAYRLALQTREQHIRREKATSNVCTSQALLANMSALYGIYHGPEGLKAIAERVVQGARAVQSVAEASGFTTTKAKSSPEGYVLFDTVIINASSADKRKALLDAAAKSGLLFRLMEESKIGISIDETTTLQDLISVVKTLQIASGNTSETAPDTAADQVSDAIAKHAGTFNMPDEFRRTSSFMTHPVFNTHHSETELLRYIHHLQSKDLSLVHSMIPLGSCTMKLNGTTEMSLITKDTWHKLHPYAPKGTTQGYVKMFRWFKGQLASITGMDAVSVQPNSGAQGEFAGLRTIRDYQKQHGKGDKPRDICLIPVSAHGTNPASAAMAGMRVVPIKCDTKTGNLDLADLEEKCKKHQEELGAIMVTYPSTFGVFEPEIKKVCSLVHEYGGQVYMDGANMNAQIGLCSPGEIGADVCHLNLHKTFCIPHGGGGPGVGPICVKTHLTPHLPRNARDTHGPGGHPVSSAPNGSASINLISWAYNTLMGPKGLKHATKIGLLNANYVLSRLKPHYEILYTNNHGRCAHEFILDVRPFSKSAGVEAIDIAKRLQDYGFHAPTMSWPVAGTLMIEPTESESREELDRFVDALISIREEIREVEEGKTPREGNVLKMSPHPIQDIIDGDGEGKWERSYSREKAAYPLPWLRQKKFWPTVARIDDAYGDLNLFCTCPPVEDTTGSIPWGGV
ncbi:glycine cleavage system P-protein-domain-containing protein [Xylariales sp. AK1849]|nr:glycine cleavage system P-protein-domain-containing protein [Xylariales sp. AK1849]